MTPDNQDRFSSPEKTASADYYIAVSRGNDPAVWQWEIHRRSRPLGIRLYGTGFISRAGARLAGETALKVLLREMAKNGARDRL